MPRKIIQDIFVVKKSIRMVKRGDVKKDPFSIEKKVPIRKTTDEKIINDRFVEEEKLYDNDAPIYEERKKVTKDSIIFLWIVLIAAVAILLFILSSTFSTAIINIKLYKSKFII